MLLIAGAVAIGVQLFFSMNWSNESKELGQELAVLENEAERIRSTGFPRVQYDTYLQSVQLFERIKSEQTDWLPYLQAVVTPLEPGDRVIAISLNEQVSILLDIHFKTYESSFSYLKSLESNVLLKDVRVISYSKRIDETARTSVSADAQTIEQAKPFIYKVQIELGLNNVKGAVTDAN